MTIMETLTTSNEIEDDRNNKAKQAFPEDRLSDNGTSATGSSDSSSSSSSSTSEAVEDRVSASEEDQEPQDADIDYADRWEDIMAMYNPSIELPNVNDYDTVNDWVHDMLRVAIAIDDAPDGDLPNGFSLLLNKR